VSVSEEEGREKRKNAPPPAGVATYSTHLEQSDGEESSEEVGAIVDRPEESEADGQVKLGICAEGKLERISSVIERDDERHKQ
jgi:hypothetical protein